MANPVTREDDKFFYVQTQNSGEKAVAKAGLSPSTLGMYRAALEKTNPASAPVPGPMTPASAPTQSVMTDFVPKLDTAAAPAPGGRVLDMDAATADEYVPPATVPVAQQTAPAMPMQMTTVSEQPSSSMAAKTFTPEAEKALIESKRLATEAIQAQTQADIEGIQAEMEMKKALNEEQVKLAQTFQQNEATRLTRLQEAQDAYSSAVKELGTTKVDPNNYWKEKTTGQKIAVGIALAMGAIGQSLANAKENYAIRAIENAIDRDLAAQKANIATKGESVRLRENSLAALRQRLGDERLADLAAKESALEVVKGQFIERIGASKSEAAKAAGLKAIAELSGKQAELRAQATAVQQTIAAGGQKSSVTVDSTKPGTGRSDDPMWTRHGKAPDAEAAKKVREADAAYGEGMAELANYRAKIKEIGTLSPYKWGTKEKGAWDAATESVKNMLRQVKNMGVLQPSESKELDNRLGGLKTPAQLESYAKELEGWLGRSMKAKLNAYGVGNRNGGTYTPASYAGG